MPSHQQHTAHLHVHIRTNTAHPPPATDTRTGCTDQPTWAAASGHCRHEGTGAWCMQALGSKEITSPRDTRQAKSRPKKQPRPTAVKAQEACATCPLYCHLERHHHTCVTAHTTGSTAPAVLRPYCRAACQDAGSTASTFGSVASQCGPDAACWPSGTLEQAPVLTRPTGA
jgi:hypothetical protein